MGTAMNKPLSIVFMGTPEFAVPSLRALHQKGHHIALVVTQPDRPKGRGRNIQASAVKNTALELQCPVIQPKSVKTDEFIHALEKLEPDLIVVIAYGHILPKPVLDIPKFGAVNIHASLLPKYRGPAPIQWAIINAEKKTGVTAMRMDPGLDTGDILLQREEWIQETETAADLHDRLSLSGADLLLETVDKIQNRSITVVPQDQSQATYAPLLTKKHGRIDWEKPAHAIDALIRGVTPWPGAFTYHRDKRLKILAASPLDIVHREMAGTILKGFADELRVAAGLGILLILEIQSESGKRLLVQDFLRGYALTPGERLH
jgi:methionyl-tRNA formyltransferase